MLEYLPHYSCLLYDKGLIATLLLGELMIILAYLWTPLIYLKAQRECSSVRADPQMRRVYRWSAAFVFSCAVTHTFVVITLFLGGGWYWGHAAASVLTGIISLYTALRVISTVPKLLTQREGTLRDISDEIMRDKNLESLNSALAKLAMLRGKTYKSDT